MLLQVGEGKKKKFNVCIKKKNTFTWNAPTHTSTARELFGTMLFSLFIAMCVHGAVGCDVMACRGKLKFQLLSRFFLRLFFSRSCNTKEKKLCAIENLFNSFIFPFPFLSQQF